MHPAQARIFPLHTPFWGLHALATFLPNVLVAVTILVPVLEEFEGADDLLAAGKRFPICT
jgi:hypothetical protein